MPYIGPQPVPLANERLTPGKLLAGEQVYVVPRGYAVGHVFVFLNGAFLPPDQYTAVDGSTIDIGEVLTNDADILVLEQKTFARADHYDKGEADARFAQLAAANDFSLMPSVGGAPIVESGSNTDGEWTKWAEGTAICWGVGISKSPLNVPADTTLSKAFSWQYPTAFTKNFPAVNVGQYLGDSNLSGANIVFVTVRRSENPAPLTQAVFDVRNVSPSTGSDRLVDFFPVAFGRWK